MKHNSQGFTLLEILVAVVLLSMMVLIVSTVLSETSRVVTIAETKMRQNNAAACLAQSIRTGLLRASKDGPLCITEVAGRPRLIVTNAGVTPSVNWTARGTASFSVLGLVNNQADAARGLLWTPTWVLTTSAGTSTDVWAYDMANIQSYTRQGVNTSIINQPSFTGTVSNLYVPPRAGNLTDVNLLWQVAASNITSLSIMWSDGTKSASGAGGWYGRSNPKDSAWAAKNSTMLDGNPAIIEYSEGGNYRALWTLHNQNLWPRAIKIRFTVVDTAMPPDFQTCDYEVIGTIGQ